jgi:hypothetical protein
MLFSIAINLTHSAGSLILVHPWTTAVLLATGLELCPGSGLVGDSWRFVPAWDWQEIWRGFRASDGGQFATSEKFSGHHPPMDDGRACF